MIRKLLISLWLSLLGAGFAAQAQAPEPVIYSGGKVITLAWGGLTWHIPERFFFGVRTWGAPKTENSETLWIQSVWNKDRDDFSPHATTSKSDIFIDIKISKVDDEDPRNALAVIHRIHLPFTAIPIFASAKFNGMKYLGTSSTNHYFTFNGSDAYVSCRLITLPQIGPPKVRPDVLSRQFTCGTVFYLPHKIYVGVSIWGVAISDAAPAFNAAHRL